MMTEHKIITMIHRIANSLFINWDDDEIFLKYVDKFGPGFYSCVSLLRGGQLGVILNGMMPPHLLWFTSESFVEKC